MTFCYPLSMGLDSLVEIGMIPITLIFFFQVYNHMSLLLKSLLSVTRSTPAYRLSRRQVALNRRIKIRIQDILLISVLYLDNLYVLLGS